MTEWGVVGVLIAMVGFIISIVTPMIKLAQTITKLTTVVESLKSDYNALSKKTTDGRHKIWDELNIHRDTLSKHETRIQLLENNEKKVIRNES